MRRGYFRSCGGICADNCTCVLALATCTATSHTLWLLLSTFDFAYPKERWVTILKHKKRNRYPLAGYAPESWFQGLEWAISCSEWHFGFIPARSLAPRCILRSAISIATRRSKYSGLVWWNHRGYDRRSSDGSDRKNMKLDGGSTLTTPDYWWSEILPDMA